MEPVISPQDTK